MARGSTLVATLALYICAHTTSVTAEVYVTSGDQAAITGYNDFAYTHPAVMSHYTIPAQNIYSQAVYTSINKQPYVQNSQAQTSDGQAGNSGPTHKNSANDWKPPSSSNSHVNPSTTLPYTHYEPRSNPYNNDHVQTIKPPPNANPGQNRGYQSANGDNRDKKGFSNMAPATDSIRKSTRNQNNGGQTGNRNNRDKNGFADVNNLGKMNRNPTQPPYTQSENFHYEKVSNSNPYNDNDQSGHARQNPGTSSMNEHNCDGQTSCKKWYGNNESTQVRPVGETDSRRSQVSAGDASDNSYKRSDPVIPIARGDDITNQGQNYRDQAGNVLDNGYNNFKPTIKPTTELEHNPFKVVYAGNKEKNYENISNQRQINEYNVANGGHADKNSNYPYDNQGYKGIGRTNSILHSDLTNNKPIIRNNNINANIIYRTSSPSPQTNTHPVYIKPYWEVINERNRNNIKKNSHNRKHDSNKNHGRNSYRKRWNHKRWFRKQYGNKNNGHNHSSTHRNSKDYKYGKGDNDDSNKKNYNIQKYNNDGWSNARNEDRSNNDDYDNGDQKNGYNYHQQTLQTWNDDRRNSYYNDYNGQHTYDGHDDSFNQNYNNDFKRRRSSDNYFKNNGDDENYNHNNDFERQKYNNDERSVTYSTSHKNKNNDGRDSRRNVYHRQNHNGWSDNQKSRNNYGESENNSNKNTLKGQVKQFYKKAKTFVQTTFGH